MLWGVERVGGEGVFRVGVGVLLLFNSCCPSLDLSTAFLTLFYSPPVGTGYVSRHCSD